MQKTAAMHDVARRGAIPIVFCFDVVEGFTRKMLQDMALRPSLPLERAIGYRLIGTIDNHGVMRARGSEEVSPLRRSVVDTGSRIRQNFRCTDIQNKRECVCVPMAAVEHAEASTIKDELAVMQTPDL